MKEIIGNIASPIGFSADGVHAKMKKAKRDLGVVYSEVPANCAGVFTTNQVQAAPVKLDREVLKGGKLQAIIVNSGNANAVTGEQGMIDAKKTQDLLAAKLSIEASQVAVCSTGVIGKCLPMDKIEAGIELLDLERHQPEYFSESILTTDLVKKEIVVTEEFAGKTVTMSGVAKGSGMIHPNMATMLAFITTDANISSELLQQILAELTETTFNQITVDGDTSTNDTVLVMANGLSGQAEIQKESEDYAKFKLMLAKVMSVLAQKIAADGEGATKLIEVNVKGARNNLDARLMAKKIVGSPLVKTAIFGSDPNWGRIICALGYAGPAFNPEVVDIALAEQFVLKQAVPVSFEQEKMQAALNNKKVVIDVFLNQGESEGTAWGCDLTYAYVEINALYHT
ncbi:MULTISPECIES: bifunctional glutamate N-acetyltransferase/amino-acid acetyltransferase ArgJ [unclassified Enterococcus]|uniref:bifunctional glutamate N-acetyltransferase/amino-acid acetyltransferase ArgJ n=1 Tax=unclassified Enterococcus TaxID=2608891 RepID=UPI001551DCB7|nr:MULTISPECIES: bifunctional glutamate N-acetyltransferase/amino-acid acetyltransferase ArgJ [unclassified Enterococcus]MBS7576359.1 bifunctional glutamate N-acetyltransferase/amino-acid acetyltransferase ArgJ [Enterococcus sp. MMGLQ5-2]MBS7583591.1 bifunctional glutamate N-acetyltransferase/amino-acid acetyltransferase ArgJ [Enterococcus sp. MMGLQ5-1]NPD11453.1 bifunctional glutamate N-acetyltransferase/amino-acid acetyltransferase ArgJ [Enterococcus sp. MMGLQ5-1]NPD36197.1 bifunctional gluta